MDDRKILLIFAVGFFGVYCISSWSSSGKTKVTLETKENTISPQKAKVEEIIQGDGNALQQKIKENLINKPFAKKDVSSVLEIFTKKPDYCEGLMEIDGNNAVIAIGIVIFLIILIINAILDAVKVKEEERAKRKLNPDGERRQSLAEFANKKPIRRESSKFGLHLFQIAESFRSCEEEKKDKKQTRPYTRGDSTNSYLSDKTPKEGSAPASVGDPLEPKLVKRQSVSKLFGARPVPMVRRSSFPALPLNPDIQAMMLGHRQTSVDSDDEGDGRGRRVRLIRRF